MDRGGYFGIESSSVRCNPAASDLVVLAALPVALGRSR